MQFVAHITFIVYCILQALEYDVTNKAMKKAQPSKLILKGEQVHIGEMFQHFLQGMSFGLFTNF